MLPALTLLFPKQCQHIVFVKAGKNQIFSFHSETEADIQDITAEVGPIRFQLSKDLAQELEPIIMQCGCWLMSSSGWNVDTMMLLWLKLT